MTSVDRQWPRWLLTSPDVVANLRWVIFGMLCLETISAFYDYAVDPNLVVNLLFVAQAASALAAGATLLWRAHLLGLCFFVLTVVLTAINDPIGIELLVLVLLFFLIGLRAGRRLKVISAIGGCF